MQEKYYSELNEIPLYNFEKCMEGDYRYISRELIEKWGINEVEAFSRIYNLYVHKYQKKDLDSKIRLYQSIISLQCKFIETKNEMYLTQIELKKAMLPEVSEEKPKQDTQNTLTILSKWMGFRLIPREITVDEFYSIVRNYERANKKV